MRRVSVGAIVATVMLSFAAPAEAVMIEPIPGLARPRVSEGAIVASEHYYAYAIAGKQNVVAKVRSRTTGEVLTIDAPGVAVPQGFIPGTDEVLFVWQHEGLGGESSGLYLYDPSGETIDALLPSPWDEEWVYSGQISSTYVLLTFSAANSAAVVLYDRSDDSWIELKTWPLDRNDVFADAVGDRYATWTRCGFTTCRVYVYDAVLDVMTVLPRAARTRFQYSSALDEADDRFYFVRGDARCGDRVRIRSVGLSDLSGSTSLVSRLPEGQDVGQMSTFHEPGPDRVDLYVSRYDCDREKGDAFVARGVS